MTPLTEQASRGSSRPRDAFARSSDGDTMEDADQSAIALDPLLEAARKAGRAWGRLSFAERRSRLLAFRDLLVDHLEGIVEAAQRDVDKPAFDVTSEVLNVADLIGYYAKRGGQLLRPRRRSSGLLLNKRAELHYEPCGVVGVISPWNYPLVLSIGTIIPALVAGNAVLLKPSERVPTTNLLLEELLAESDLGAPLVKYLHGGPDAALSLAESSVDKIVYIGGTVGGRAVLRATAERLTPTVLELGGNDAMIVAEDADIERAAAAAVWGSFFNAGQSCIAVERCYAHASIIDRFVERVVERTERLRQGYAVVHDGQEDQRDLGPVISTSQGERIRELLDDAVAKGAVIRCGGVPDAIDARLFPPTVITNVDHTMRLTREEVFGPLLPIMSYESDGQAIDLANDSPFGLSASVWSSNQARARRIAADLDVGGVVINDNLVHFAFADLPFGGVKESGFGRLHGREGLMEFCRTKSVVTHRFGPRMELQWFPVRGKIRLLRRLSRLLYRSGWSRFR
ncbi:Putative succinate-semialdehyde dehydrogenase [NADP(+)] 2 [Planctomycetes bacterium Pan216]|uniref:Aldehyde dehydrogenase n=1 Tax=Kolteria novifilia TaxID=2527975 RepID=A0A518B262_9BACT|nr:Putative succinate-semialdehyde dehydrogenase [NADP(+)] 2 [Planctomycetes bacterium Pan216]